MDFRVDYVEGIEFLVPEGVDLPLHLDQFPDACGPGKGLGERVVPEKIFGLRVSPACWIHDKSWECADPTVLDFHISNIMFVWNLFSIIEAFPSKWWIANVLREYRAVTYFNAVNGPLGRRCFEREKGVKVW